jgi:DNA-binding response OmpR family regulator
MRVLLVEDEAMTAFDLTAEFQAHGHVVLGPAKELEHSLNLALAERPDLALVDINLNGSSVGLQIAATLTNVLRVPVVFLTAHKPDARAHRSSAKGLITKPVPSGQVVECAEALGLVLAGEPTVVPSDLELFDSMLSREATSANRDLPNFALLVASDEAVRVRMNLLLGRSGCSVVSVPDCETARDELRAIIYPIVVIDRGAAGGNGFDLIREIRNIGSRDRTFIVVLSASDSRADVATDLIAGADGYVSKRCSDEEILESLRNVLSIIRRRSN